VRRIAALALANSQICCPDRIALAKIVSFGAQWCDFEAGCASCAISGQRHFRIHPPCWQS